MDLVSLRMNRIRNKKCLKPETLDGIPCRVLDLSGFFAPVPSFSAVTHTRLWISEKDGLPRRVIAWTQKSGVFVTDIRYKERRADKSHAYLLPSRITISPRPTLASPIYTRPLVIRFDQYRVEPPRPESQDNSPSLLGDFKIDFK